MVERIDRLDPDRRSIPPVAAIGPLELALGRRSSAFSIIRRMSSSPAIETDASPRRKRKRRLVFGLYPLLTMLLAAGVGVGVAASIHMPQVDSLDEFVPKLITELYDRNGQIIRGYSKERRVLLEAGDLPPLLQNAILATEDANFFEHSGIDVRGVVRAFIKNLKEGRRAEGASTITMQLARDVFHLTRAKNYWRKFEEALLAIELEKNYSKQQILTLHCNMLNEGNGNYGVEAAARNYFNKSVAELSLVEAATLAGIPQRPSAFNVYSKPEAVTERRNVVLQRMYEENYITAEELEQARVEPLIVVPKRRERHIGPYYSEEIRRYLISTYGETKLYERGLQVETTLDRTIQRAAEKALRDQLLALDHGKGWRGPIQQLDPETVDDVELPSWRDPEPLPGDWLRGVVLSSGRSSADILIRGETHSLDAQGIEWTKVSRPSRLLKRGDVAWFRFAEPESEDDGGQADDTSEPEPEKRILMLEQEPEIEGAVLVMESRTGAIRAMVGGWDYDRNEFNRVTQAKRQVGSAFKIFVFGAALENGFTAADSLFDGPAVFPGAEAEESYSPRNYKRQYYGIITLRRALEASINVFSVKLMDLVGVDHVIDFARRSGITEPLPPYPSLALGAADLTPLELAASYATVANLGTYVEPYTIERIATPDGRVLEEHTPRAHKAMEPQIAYVLQNILRGVSRRGTAAGQLARIELPTGGKTGTTNLFTDAWFVGFTPKYTLLSWVGYDKTRSLGRGMTGARAALPIWASVIRQGLEDGWLDPTEEFRVPPGIASLRVDQASGLLPSRSLERRTITESFIDGTQPERRVENNWARILELPWYLQEPFYLPIEGESHAVPDRRLERRSRSLGDEGEEGGRTGRARGVGTALYL